MCRAVTAIHRELGLTLTMSETGTITQQEFISELLTWCALEDTTDPRSSRYRYQSKHMTWAHQLKQALTTIDTSRLSSFVFESRLKETFVELKIEIIPGLYRGNLTAKQWLKIIPHIDSTSSLRLPIHLHTYTAPVVRNSIDL